MQRFTWVCLGDGSGEYRVEIANLLPTRGEEAMPKNRVTDCFVSVAATEDEEFFRGEGLGESYVTDYFLGKAVGETTPNFRSDGTPADRLDLCTNYTSLSVKPGEGWDAQIRVGSPEEPYESLITPTRAQALELARWLQARFG